MAANSLPQPRAEISSRDHCIVPVPRHSAVVNSCQRGHHGEGCLEEEAEVRRTVSHALVLALALEEGQCVGKRMTLNTLQGVAGRHPYHCFINPRCVGIKHQGKLAPGWWLCSLLNGTGVGLTGRNGRFATHLCCVLSIILSLLWLYFIYFSYQFWM